MNIQHIRAAHWQPILAIQAEAYAGFGPEELTVLKSKAAASPKSCLVGLSEQGAVQAYVLAHP